MYMSIAEKWMHEYFEEYRSNGEWFDLPDNEISDLLDFCEGASDFSAAIYHAYGWYVFDKITETEEEGKSLCEWLHKESNGTASILMGGCESDFVRWIEDLFADLAYWDYSKVPSDIAAKFKARDLNSFFIEEAV